MVIIFIFSLFIFYSFFWGYYNRRITMLSREYTPVQDKHRTGKWGADDEKSLENTQIHKTYSANRSTEYGSKSPYKSMAVSRLEDARRTIDEVIVDLSEKRDMNEEAMREVRSVNSEIIEDFRRNSPYERKAPMIHSPSRAEAKSAYASTYDLRSQAPLQDDSLVLRERLNEELKKNNELLMRMSRLQQENAHMKREFQMSFGPSSQAQQLRNENERLKMSLSQASQIPQQIFNEIQQLKRQNQGLRQDTVKLLKKLQRF